jgi:predicted Rossmann-fold nucleotide-binding protein
MQAANEGADSVKAPERNRSVGIRIELPFEQDVNPFVTEAFEHKTFFTRLHHFVLTSDAFVVTPGGIGTVLELMMVWQLLQVRQMKESPLILVGKMWEGLVAWTRDHLLSTQPPLISPEDVDIPKCVRSGDEAIALIKKYHSRWNSERASSRPRSK